MHCLTSIGIILPMTGAVLIYILKRPLKTSDKSNEEHTIMDIAYMSGFNSKTGFNRAFKDVTGKTPTEYLEN